VLQTKISEMSGIEYPIISAGMAAVGLSALAAAVSEAGGLGTIGLAGFTPEGIHNEISAARARTGKPPAANLIVPFMRADQASAPLSVQTPARSARRPEGEPAAFSKLPAIRPSSRSRCLRSLIC
jgi:NAD(P)H-dependent flavin oxidoreductase YrpB (nitropropane dioxygenase family)